MLRQPAGAIAGLRVLDLSRILAGPICTMVLGDHGADVIKVEPPGGDETRTWGPPFVGAEGGGPGYKGESAYYLFGNRNKRSIVLDLRTEAGQEIIRRLAGQTDVIVENFKPGTMTRWGLDYETVLRPLNPRLIYCNVSAFGPEGPRSNLLGYDVLAQAMGGMMSITGGPDAGPTRVGVAIADLTTGMLAVQAILLALASRDRTGAGQRVDVSLLESIVSLLTHLASNYLVGGIEPRRYGNSHPSIVPYQLFQCADREIYIAVGNDKQFQRLCHVMERPDLALDPRFAANADRVANRDALTAELSSELRRRPVLEWTERFWPKGVPAAPIQTLPEVFSDPQVLHRDMVISVPHPTAGQVRMTGIPIKLTQTPGAVRRPPPLLGEHTAEVLSEVGYDPATVAALEASGIIKCWQGKEG